MIPLRFAHTFRERAPEWILSTAILAWGMIVFISTDLFFNQEFYHPLLLITSQLNWAIFGIVVGSVRLIFLVINGAWRPSAHIRAIGCLAGCMLWGALLISVLSLNWLAPASGIYASLLSLDLLSMWFAAGDAKLADLSAKKEY